MLVLKPDSNFFVQETGQAYQSAYLRIGDVKYDFDGKSIQLELKFYASKEAYENQQPTIVRRRQTASQADFEKWFDLSKINVNNNLLRRISDYLAYLQSGGLFLTGYIRVGEFIYNRDESRMQIEVRTYPSEQSYLENETPDRIVHDVSQIDFNAWFNFDAINSGDSIVRRIFGYITQLPGIYPGTLVFGDWIPDLS